MFFEIVRTGDRPVPLPSPHASSCTLGDWLKQAEADDAEAYYRLGEAFSSEGHGVAADLVEALKWFTLASAAGHEDGARGEIATAAQLSERELHEARSRARLWRVVNAH